MKRRKLLKRSLLLGTAGLVAGGGWWLHNGEDLAMLTIEQCQQRLRDLPLNRIKVVGEWNLAQVFNHLAQSIEYSMTGYPQHKSDAFKKYLGQHAFAVFTYRGRMAHDLAEAIPGAAPLADHNAEQALARLLQALTDFQNHPGDLQPHFAYGELTPQEYTWAHVMHVYNHLEAFEVV
ncbi:DUF1569 domain-containing protein [Marinicella meishanensis]|uniref:DUF1569 domain-containing protein n=1 Tax=Marinicella meishanensis TaxID=2873263 RepID=UPI001CBF76BD|nr:DUF1569 domain-containing protein [Marinicella sp. NBU2979]